MVDCLKYLKKRRAGLSARKKDEEDFNTINEIINKHKDIKRTKYKLKRKKLGLPWHKIKAIKRTKSKSKNKDDKEIEKEKDKTFKKAPVLDHILIENNELFDSIFNSLKPKEETNEFLKKKRKMKKNFIVFKDTNNDKIKSTTIFLV